MEKILRKIEKLIPQKIYKLGQPIYHFLLAIVGQIIYRFPARKMIVIGVTGTKGKTSTANFIYSVLAESGETVGLISTANIKFGSEEIPNKYHMSMPGRFILQKLLRQMRNLHCKYVVLEVTSEGIKQFRHLGLFLDVSVFTNLSPEHLASHGGSLVKYRATKMRIFSRAWWKPLKLVLINRDDENAKYFIEASQGLEQILFSIEEVENLAESESGMEFRFSDYNYKLNILGKFNVYNAMPAIILGRRYGLTKQGIEKGLAKLNLIPGRMEEIREGQDFKVIVDYAHEKVSMTNLLQTARNLKASEANKVILALGGDGGGRDEQRLYDMGTVAGELADIVIVSNSDPYEDNQLELAQKISKEVEKSGKLEGKDLFITLDRGQAIEQAVDLAKDGDVVLLATRGSLTTMSIGGKKIKSDDRVLAREAIQKK